MLVIRAEAWESRERVVIGGAGSTVVLLRIMALMSRRALFTLLGQVCCCWSIWVHIAPHEVLELGVEVRIVVARACENWILSLMLACLTDHSGLRRHLVHLWHGCRSPLLLLGVGMEVIALLRLPLVRGPGGHRPNVDRDAWLILMVVGTARAILSLVWLFLRRRELGN